MPPPCDQNSRTGPEHQDSLQNACELARLCGAAKCHAFNHTTAIVHATTTDGLMMALDMYHATHNLGFPVHDEPEHWR